MALDKNCPTMTGWVSDGAGGFTKKIVSGSGKGTILGPGESAGTNTGNNNSSAGSTVNSTNRSSTSTSGALTSPTPGNFTPSQNDYKAAQVDTSSIGKFGPSTSVAEKMEGLLSKDNPLMKLARTSAQQQANSRGLLNSSIAAGEGQKAMIASAMPIAQQDAQTENQFTMNDQGFGFNAALTNAQMENQLTGQRMAGDYSLANTGYSGQIEGLLSRQAHSQTLEQMTAAQRDVLEQMAANHGYDLSKMNQDQINTLSRMAEQQGYDMSKMGAAYKYDLGTMKAGTRHEENLAYLQNQLQKNRMVLEKDLNKELADKNADLEKELKQMDITSSDKNTIMEVVGRANQQYMNEFTAISTNPELDEPTKISLLTSLQNNYTGTINAQISMAGFDFDLFESFENYGGEGDSESGTGGGDYKYEGNGNYDLPAV